MIINNVLPIIMKPSTSFIFANLRHPKQLLIVLQKRLSSSEFNFKDSDGWISRRIGNREIVGYGINGQPEYIDRIDFPFPSLRYKPPTPEFQALREKEKGDWRLLSMEEKKALYRANFCQTFAEFQAPTGEWMYIFGGTLMLVSVGIWFFILLKLFVYSQYPLPKSFTPVSQQLQLRRIINMRNNPINGLCSKWDYEKKKWKSKPWYIPWDDPFAPIEECAEDQED